MTPHITFATLGQEGRGLIAQGAICAMKGQARDYWPLDTLDEELRELLVLYRLERQLTGGDRLP